MVHNPRDHFGELFSEHRDLDKIRTEALTFPLCGSPHFEFTIISYCTFLPLVTALNSLSRSCRVFVLKSPMERRARNRPKPQSKSSAVGLLRVLSPLSLFISHSLFPEYFHSHAHHWPSHSHPIPFSLQALIYVTFLATTPGKVLGDPFFDSLKVTPTDFTPESTLPLPLRLSYFLSSSTFTPFFHSFFASSDLLISCYRSGGGLIVGRRDANQGYFAWESVTEGAWRARVRSPRRRTRARQHHSDLTHNLYYFYLWFSISCHFFTFLTYFFTRLYCFMI